jgi:hypothetical protein
VTGQIDTEVTALLSLYVQELTAGKDLVRHGYLPERKFPLASPRFGSSFVNVAQKQRNNYLNKLHSMKRFLQVL